MLSAVNFTMLAAVPLACAGTVAVLVSNSVLSAVNFAMLTAVALVVAEAHAVLVASAVRSAIHLTEVPAVPRAFTHARSELTLATRGAADVASARLGANKCICCAEQQMLHRRV